MKKVKVIRVTSMQCGPFSHFILPLAMREFYNLGCIHVAPKFSISRQAFCIFTKLKVKVSKLYNKILNFEHFEAKIF